MTPLEVVAAWKDTEWRDADLTHPAGDIALALGRGILTSTFEDIVTQPWNCDTAYTCTNCFVTCTW